MYQNVGTCKKSSSVYKNHHRSLCFEVRGVNIYHLLGKKNKYKFWKLHPCSERGNDHPPFPEHQSFYIKLIIFQSHQAILLSTHRASPGYNVLPPGVLLLNKAHHEVKDDLWKDRDGNLSTLNLLPPSHAIPSFNCLRSHESFHARRKTFHNVF